MILKKIKAHHLFLLVSILILLIGMYRSTDPNSNLAINIHDTYFVMSNYHCTLILFTTYFLTGIVYWLFEKHPTVMKMLKQPQTIWTKQMATLGSGNHFIEICVDENKDVWVMLHSGSRGIGNAIGQYFTQLAKRDMGKHIHNLPDKVIKFVHSEVKHADLFQFFCRFIDFQKISNSHD